MTDTEAINKKIASKGIKKTFIAEEILGITYQSLCLKIRNVTEFKPSEIVKLCSLLDITRKEKEEIFFKQ